MESTATLKRCAFGSLSEHQVEEIPLNTRLVLNGWSIEFSYSEESDRVIVKGQSGEAGYVVRQISPEKYLDFLACFEELIGTLLGVSLLPDC